MRMNKPSRKIRIKKRKKKKQRQKTSPTFVIFLTSGILFLVVILMLLYRGHTRDLAEIREAKIIEDMNKICGALGFYYQDHGSYPAGDEGLNALCMKKAPPAAGDAGRAQPPAGGYLDRLPLDPWGFGYGYRSPGDGREPELISWGADGRPGGNGEAKDFVIKGCRFTGDTQP